MKQWLTLICPCSRGIIFGYGKRPASDAVIQFVRKYHGYAMSFGTVLNFHYHPVVCSLCMQEAL